MTNRIDDAFDVLKHVDVPEPQDAKAFCFEYSCSFIVADQPGRRIVLATIEFDDEPAFVTSKVGDEPRYRDLAAEVSALRFQNAQLIPELLLCIGDVSPQMTCEVIGHCPDPHP